MTFRDDYRRLLRIGGFAVWTAVGLPVLFFQAVSPQKDRETVAFLARDDYVTGTLLPVDGGRLLT